MATKLAAARPPPLPVYNLFSCYSHNTSCPVPNQHFFWPIVPHRRIESYTLGFSIPAVCLARGLRQPLLKPNDHQLGFPFLLFSSLPPARLHTWALERSLPALEATPRSSQRPFPQPVAADWNQRKSSPTAFAAVTCRVSNRLSLSPKACRHPPYPSPLFLARPCLSRYILLISCSDGSSPTAQRGTYFLNLLCPCALNVVFLLVW